ncbi:MAG: GNAT family N-acetyltransferase [Bacteroidetes bacterium]|nr:MAG: GNAT family N-acetyltransferase [Bacteroidota bacterium]
MSLSFKQLAPSDVREMEEVKHLFEQMYLHFSRHGLLMPLAPGGATLWMESVKPALNRISCLAVGVSGNKVVGFAFASIRFSEDHIGKNKTGNIQYLFVMPEFQKKGIGKKLAEELETWLKLKEVSSIELHAVIHNEQALRFWNKHGYVREAIQFRKMIKNVQE